MRSRPVRRLALLLVAALTVAGVSATAAGAATPEEAPAQASGEQVQLRLGFFPNVTHASALVGIQSGLFEENLGTGVTLKPTVFNAGPAAVQAIFAGALDATYIGPNPAINAFQQSNGEAIRIVSGATSGGAFLVVKPAISSVKDLEGKKVATPQLGGTQDVAARSYFKENGLSTDTTGGGDVSILPQANATSLDSFKQGLIDGAWVPEPWATRLVNEGGGKILVDEADLWPDGKYVTTHLVVAKKFLDEHPDVVKKLIQGQVAANQFIADQPTVAQRLVSQGIEKYTGQPVDIPLVAATWKNLEFTNDPVASSLGKSAQDAIAVGLLQPVNLKGIYDLKILNKVLKAQGQATVSDKLPSAKAK